MKDIKNDLVWALKKKKTFFIAINYYYYKQISEVNINLCLHEKFNRHCLYNLIFFNFTIPFLILLQHL
jgi:hypothetical protein